MGLSSTIESDRSAYYEQLNRAQRDLEVSEWILWFLHTVLFAQSRSEQVIEFTLKKVRFFDTWRDRLNDRQLKVVRRMLEEGPQGFSGGMNARKYVAIAKTSKATATRDMQQLRSMGIFIPHGGGRSTSYNLKL